MMIRFLARVATISLILAAPAYANNGLLWGGGTRQPLIAPRVDPVHTVTPNLPSLFADRAGGSLFAPFPVRQKASLSVAPVTGGTPAARIRDLIASAEAGRAGYDAVVWAARVKPPKPPSQMTVGEIYDWIKATPRQHHAIGRYQFIPSTLRRLVAQAGADRDQLFTPAFQDHLANILLSEAGLQRYQAGEIGRTTFMHNLAKIWAGFPNASGRSHYHGIAGNRATMTWARFNAEMDAIFAR